MTLKTIKELENREPLLEAGYEECRMDVLEVIINAVKILKNNYYFSGKQETKEKTKEFAIGIYNRFDECGLIYSDIKGISFNEAIKELELTELMEELVSVMNGK